VTHSPAPGSRNQINNLPPPDVPDPLKVLQQIVGAPPKDQSPTNGQVDSVEKPPELVEDIDFGGLSLQAFAEKEQGSTRRKSAVHTQNTQSIEECTFLGDASQVDPD
jgi:vacuolar protein sorting-associated protein 52